MSTGNYFRGAREQAHNFGDLLPDHTHLLFLGSLAKKQKKIRKSLHFVLFFKKIYFWGPNPPDPPCKFLMYLFSY